VKVYLNTSVVIALASPEDRFSDFSLEFVRGLRALEVGVNIASPIFLELAKAVQLRGVESVLTVLQTVDRYGIELATPDPERLLNLVDRYVGLRIMGVRYQFDLLHYASATLLSCSHLASWDQDHFNQRIAKKVNKANSSLNLPTLILGDRASLRRSLGLG
jgi:hypothetical protein